MVRLLDAGFGVGTIYYGDIDPDFAGRHPIWSSRAVPEARSNGARAQRMGRDRRVGLGSEPRHGLFGDRPGVDAKRVAILGVSRLGKTVMWAGAHDTRFALVIASCSGEGGAALSRQKLWRNGRPSDRSVALSLSILCQLRKVCRTCRPDASRCEHASRADGASSGVAANRRQGSLVGPEGRVLSGGRRRARISAARETRTGYRSDACRPGPESSTPSATSNTSEATVRFLQIGISI